MPPKAVDPDSVVIAPTLLTNDPNEFTRLITLYPTFAKRMQIDVCDGTFVSTTTIPLTALTALPTNILVDLHLMVIHPSEQVQNIIRLKPNLAIFHVEATEDLLPTFQQLKAAGIKVGVALLQKTYPGDVENYIKAADHVLIFAGALGKNGGPIDLLQVEKVKMIRAMNPNAEIGWDGGVNIENIRTLAHSDINVLNVGSAIARSSDPKKAWEDLKHESTERGVRI